MTSTPPARAVLSTPLDQQRATLPGPTKRRWVARAWPFAVFALVIAVLLGPSLVGQRVALGHDLVLSQLPWSAAHPDAPPPVNPELRDTVDQYYPIHHELSSRLRSGGDATWLEDVSLGMPGIQFIGWGALSPFNLPALVLPFDLAWSWATALRLFAAMIGAYLLTRSLGAGRAGGTVAGLAFGLSGYMISWLGWPQTHVGAFIPWVWWAARLAAGGSPRPWAVAALAVSTAGLWLGGFPAVAVYALLGAGAVAAHAAWRRRAGGPRTVRAGLAAAAAGVALGTGLAAFTLLPSVLFLGELDLSTRVEQWRTRVPVSALPTFLVPGLYGDLVHHRWWHPGSRVEYIGYAGIVPLALGAAAWLLRPRRAGLGLFTGLAAVFAALAYGLPPLPSMVRVTPLLSTNSPARALALVGLALAVVGGLGADGVVRWAGGRARASRRAAAAGGAGLLIALAAAAAWNPVRRLRGFAVEQVGDQAASEALRVAAGESVKAAALVIAGAAVVVLGAALRRRLPAPALPRVAAVGLITVVAVDLLASAVGINPQVRRDELFPDAPGLAALAEASHAHRVTGTDGVLMANTHLEYGFRDVRAHTFVTQRQRALVQRFGGVFLSQTRWELRVADGITWDPWLSALGVAAILAPPEVEQVPGPVVVQRERRATIGPLTEDAVVHTTAVAPRDGPLVGVQLRLGTFGGAADDGEVIVEVTSAAGEQASAAAPVAGLADNAWEMFDVPPLEVAEGERIRVAIRGTAADPARAVVLWGTEAAEGQPLGAPALGLVLGDSRFPRQELGGVALFRNPQALPLMYAVPEAVAVAPSAAPEQIEQAGAGALAERAFVEPGPSGAMPALPAGGGQAAVTDWRREGGMRAATVESDAGALLVVLDQLFPGWTATVDGELAPVVRANELFMAVSVPPGRREVTLTYRSPGARAGGAISIASLLALAAWTVLSRRRARHAN